MYAALLKPETKRYPTGGSLNCKNIEFLVFIISFKRMTEFSSVQHEPMEQEFDFQLIWGLYFEGFCHLRGEICLNDHKKQLIHI